MKILICADSFGVIDARFPGQHWSEMLARENPNTEIFNLSIHGASNQHIQMQLFQGLLFQPDFVIISFTNTNRLSILAESSSELLENQPDFIINTLPGDQNSVWDLQNINFWNRRTKFTNCWLTNSAAKKAFDRFYHKFYDQDQDIINSVMTARSMCDTLMYLQIPFCFSSGGLSFDNLQYEKILEKNYMGNILTPYMHRQTAINLWEHQDLSEQAPRFHVSSLEIQQQFAQQCVSFINQEGNHDD